ncbi:hypothetical protein KKC_15054 [Listeria fleischmannii subsp. coloradonensis]|uniref:Mga helix-turn-helix domain-containing protein n=2 Tax=Listeria fleischmannii TaxID=1069827 RepID=A0A841YHD1_9LIST|nr:helix-turn-helix domain-containing protein [Listeria fleischmannii]EIA18955.1 hypothetical protein KKC_15054 [Listeria fleischmannii subsp. coloradonensis]MBC1399805.1 hypothetical protein [Listeria fleischmannii]MBC1428114.1 hypothetical protein [Listeria fleischmannii]
MQIKLDVIDETLAIKWELFLLLRQENRWFTTKELQTSLNISRSLVLKNISELEAEIKIFYIKKEIFLDISKGRGLKIVINKQDYNIRAFLIFLVEKTTTFKLFLSLLNENYINATRFALDNFTSDATVRRELQKLRTAFVPYQVNISQGKSMLLGKETNVRLLINMILWRIYGGEEWPFAGVNEKYIQSVTVEILSGETISLTAIQLRQLEYFIAIGILRRRQGHFVEKENWWDELTLENPAFDTFQAKVQKVANNSLEKDSGEMMFMFFLTIIQLENLSTLPLLERNFTFNENKRTFMYNYSKEFVKFIMGGKYLNRRHPIYLFSFSYHLFAKLFPMFSTDLTGYSYARHLHFNKREDVFLNTSMYIKKILKKLYKQTGDSLFLSEEYLSGKYSLLLIYHELQFSHEPKIKIRVDTDLSFFANWHIEKMLMNYFKEVFNISFLNEFSSEVPDLLLTNLTPRGNFNNKTRIITIQRNLSKRNLESIEAELLEIYNILSKIR